MWLESQKKESDTKLPNQDVPKLLVSTQRDSQNGNKTDKYWQRPRMGDPSV